MSYPSFRLALVAGLVLSLGLATASLAQDAAPPSPPGAAADAGARHHRDPAEMRAHMAEQLRAVLQLQPGQDAALETYLDALKPAGRAKDHMGGPHGGMQHLTTPERLDRMAARADEQRTRMLARIAATRQFYAQLSPSQQKAFDDLAPMMMGHGMRGHGMDGHRDGPGDGHGDWGHDGDHGMGADGPPHG